MNQNDAILFVKKSIALKDATYVKILLRDTTIINSILTALENESIDYQLNVLELIEVKSQAIVVSELFKLVLKLSLKINHKSLFNLFIKNRLWEANSSLHVFEKVYNGLLKEDRPVLVDSLKTSFKISEIYVDKRAILKISELQELAMYFVVNRKFPSSIVLQENVLITKIQKLLVEDFYFSRTLILRVFGKLKDSEALQKVFTKNIIFKFFEQELLAREESFKVVKYIFKYVQKYAIPIKEVFAIIELIIREIVLKNKEQNIFIFLTKLGSIDKQFIHYLIVDKNWAPLLLDKNQNSREFFTLKESLNRVVDPVIINKGDLNAKHLLDVKVKNTLSDLSSYIKFRGVDGQEYNTMNKELFTFLEQNSTKIIFRKKLFEWSKNTVQRDRIIAVFEINTRAQELLGYIHNRFLKLILDFDKVLSAKNLPSLKNVLNKNSDVDFVSFFLREWAHYKFIIDKPEVFLFGLVNNYFTDDTIIEIAVSKEHALEEKLKLIADKINFIRSNKIEIDTTVFQENNRSPNFDQFIYFIEFGSNENIYFNLSKKQLFKLLEKESLNNPLTVKKYIFECAQNKIKHKRILDIFQLNNSLYDLVNIINIDLIKVLGEIDKILVVKNHESIKQILSKNSKKEFVSHLLLTWTRNPIIIENPMIIIIDLMREFMKIHNLNREDLIILFSKNNESISEEAQIVTKELLVNIENLSNSDNVEVLIEQQEETGNSDIMDGVIINNAGLLILWPFINLLFTKLGLLNGQKFKDEISKSKALLATEFMVRGDLEIHDSELLLNKILCGLDPDFIIDSSLTLDDVEIDICNMALNAVIHKWEKVKTIKTLRDYFLIREGLLSEGPKGFNLVVTPKPPDMLLKFISWNISMVKTSIMNTVLNVEWKF